MKKLTFQFLALSLLVTAFPAKSATADVDAVASLMGGAVLGTGAALAGAAWLASLKVAAKFHGVSVGVLWAADKCKVTLNKENKRILSLAQQQQKDVLKKEVIELNEKFFGLQWEVVRDQRIKEFFGMRPYLFIEKYSKDIRNQMLKYLGLYKAIALLYLYKSIQAMMFHLVSTFDLVIEMDKKLGFVHVAEPSGRSM